jgi:hypothetical protein
MKSGRTAGVYFKFSGIILALILLAAFYGHRYLQPSAQNGTGTSYVSTGVAKPAAKKMVPGAACCKASFSRSKMLSAKSTHTAIAPASK